MKKSLYHPPNREQWTGRQTDPDLGPEYWFQCVELLDLSKDLPEDSPDYALLGYACDEGVRRNQGRVGAAAGAKEARKRMGGLANYLGGIRLADAGDILCPDQDLETTQETFSAAIHQLLEAGIRPVAIGGGHDIAFAHFRGIRAAVEGSIGIINFDAHFDLREPVNGPTSGTPFNQILMRYEGVGYLAVGIQRAANPPSLFRTANLAGASYIFSEACGSDPDSRAAVINRISSFASAYDHLYVTIDMDGFSAAIAPGVSAPSPLGFSAEFFFPVLAATLATGKVTSIDLAEFNPTYDRDGVTARLLARIVERIVR